MSKRKSVLWKVSAVAVLPLMACGPAEEADMSAQADADEVAAARQLLREVPAGQDFVPGEVLIQYEAGATETQRLAARARIGASLKESIHTATMKQFGAGVLEVAFLPSGMSVSAAARGLEGTAGVRFAEPNFIYRHTATSSDPYYTNGSLWGMYGDATTPANQFGSQAGEAWAKGRTGSSSIVVGVIDEGIQVTHPDLSANIWVNPYDPVDGIDNDGNGYVDDTHGWDFVNNDRTVYDGGNTGRLDKHGTHVAGTIGAVSNGTGVVGVTWNVKMISAKFLGQNGGTTANAIRSVDYITDLKTRHGIDLVATNNSWGGGGFSQALFDAIERANKANILFMAAAGNGGGDGIGDDNDKTPQYPASYPHDNIIAVASITSSGARSSFSNYGATSVDLGAPGSGINSTLPFNTYGSYSGTSMATPHVAGGAALRAAHSTSRGAALKADILNSAVPTPSLAGRCVTGGRLDVSGF
jgi:subtilisin family serine protease